VKTYVYGFAAFDDPDRNLLGGKGADLAEMVRLGLPVPPGFTITTEACRYYLEHGSAPVELARELDEHLAALEHQAGRRFGDAADPLLVSVRSGAAISMPGMMETVLNVGLNDLTVHGLAERTGDLRFALDSYRRLIQMFGETVFGVPVGVFGGALDAIKERRGVADDLGLDADALRDLIDEYHRLTKEHVGRSVPQDPREQLDLAVIAVFGSWNTDRARAYRQHQGISDDLATAVNVQAMVFGNLGAHSGSGVCFTRDPATGAFGDYGEYLPTAQGEDVVSGVRTAVPLSELHTIDPAAYRRLRSLLGSLERHYRDVCDVEFTIEDGMLWILQTRIGKRSAEAAFQLAYDFVEEGTINLDEALSRVTGDQLAHLMFPRLDTSAGQHPLTTGLGASPGSAVGRVALDSATAAAWAANGDAVVLVRKETRPDDLPGMLAAVGVLTSRGGRTSHAAVVARGLGRPCVCGASALDIDLDARTVVVPGGPTVTEGDVISMDGDTGDVYAGALPVADSSVVRWLEGDTVDSPLITAVSTLMAHADAVRRLRVRANADNGPDAERAVRFGAEGIGLTRTEHMFLGERSQLIERVIVADDPAEQADALAALLPVQRTDFAAIFAAMDGRPVTIRLIDPPLHEFLPDLTDLSVRVALAEQAGGASDHDTRLLAAVRRLHEENPMMGMRGVRLAIVVPGLIETQARAALEAAAAHRRAGGSVELEIMVPLLATAGELAVVRDTVEKVAREVGAELGEPVEYRLGAMIETPRAALVADEIVRDATFLSFGTNDLTQMTWGLSRDDAESSFLPQYVAAGIVRTSPFETIDLPGVGHLVRTAADLARRADPTVTMGVCGEHGGDPTSIGFFDEVGLDYVSCSPFRVPVARLEAGRAALLHKPVHPVGDGS